VLREGEPRDGAGTRRLLTRLLDVDKPIISAINGDAIGLAATIVFVHRHHRRGRDCSNRRHPREPCRARRGRRRSGDLPLLVGISRAKEFLLRGTLLTGSEAAEIGLVNHAVPAEQVLPYAQEIARELASGPTWAIRWTKASVNLLLKERLNAVLPASPRWRWFRPSSTTTTRRREPSPRNASRISRTVETLTMWGPR